MKKRYRSILFIDLDNTVMNGPFASAVFPVVIREISEKSEILPETVRQMIAAENRQRRTDPRCPAVRAMDWEDIARTIAHRLGVSLEADVEELVCIHAKGPHARPVDGAAEVLRELACPGRLLIAASRGLRKYQMPVLEGIGLAGFFDHILTPDVCNAMKESRPFYGTWPEQADCCISVGDKYEDDIIPPAGFGFRTVWKPRKPDMRLSHLNPFERAKLAEISEERPVRPDAVIHTLRELPGVADFLESTIR